VTEGRQGEALHIYQELLESKVIPWAKMGVARIQADQGMQGESSALLKSSRMPRCIPMPTTCWRKT
jgi:hypothetical protein